MLRTDLRQRNNSKGSIDAVAEPNVQRAHVVKAKDRQANRVSGTPGGNQRFESFFVNARTIERDDSILCIQALFISRRAGANVPDENEVSILFKVRAQKSFLRRDSDWS